MKRKILKFLRFYILEYSDLLVEAVISPISGGAAVGKYNNRLKIASQKISVFILPQHSGAAFLFCYKM